MTTQKIIRSTLLVSTIFLTILISGRAHTMVTMYGGGLLIDRMNVSAPLEDYEFSLSFLFPTGPDHLPGSPEYGSWITQGTGWLTAYGTTTFYEGVVTLTMAGALGSGGSFGATIQSGSHYLCAAVESRFFFDAVIPDDNPMNIFDLPRTAYLDTDKGYSDMETIRARYTPVPDSASTGTLLFIAGTICCVFIGKYHKSKAGTPLTK